MVKSMSKTENFLKIILKKFIKKHKNKEVNLTLHGLKKIYIQQNKKCAITLHPMDSIVDIRQRTDNIWNISILILDKTKQIIDKNNILLVCNLVYSTKNIYNLNLEDLRNIYTNFKLSNILIDTASQS